MKISFKVVAEANVPLIRLRALLSTMIKTTNEFKRCLAEAKELHVRQIERLQRERDAALLAASQLDDPNAIVNQLPPNVEIPNKKVSSL